MKNAGKEGSESTVPKKNAPQETGTRSKPRKQAAGKAGAGKAKKEEAVPQQTPSRRPAGGKAANRGNRSANNKKSANNKSANKKSTGTGGQTRRRAKSPQGGTEKSSRAEQVQELLQDLKDKLKKDTIKASIADYIRLVQLENQLVEDDAPTEIKVTWIDPATDESASGQ
jgi:hypothetical protein